jgi:hypothetical protein
MKTLQQAKEEYKSECFDGRDLSRLAKFIHEKDLSDFGIELKGKYKGKWDRTEYREFTKENVLIQLQKDLDFAFEKAYNQRGISSSCMFEVIQMWSFILEDGVGNCYDYCNYGLPLYIAMSKKYGFEIPTP